MTTREELAAAVYDAVRSASNRVAWDELRPRSQKYWLDIAEALLASPALARVIREAKEEAWDEGRRTGSSRAMRRMSDEPSLPLASESDNPYTVKKHDEP